MLYNIKYIIHINVYYNIINYFTSYINMKVIKHKTCKEKICISQLCIVINKHLLTLILKCYTLYVNNKN